jgi:hypothetical protein
LVIIVEDTNESRPDVENQHPLILTEYIRSEFSTTTYLIVSTDDSEYKTGFAALLMGSTKTAIQAYTSPGITTLPDMAARPEVNYFFHLVNEIIK